MSAGYLDRIEHRLADVQDAIASNPYGSPVATGWYAQDVPALVKVARAARAAMDKAPALMTDNEFAHALNDLAAALEELEADK